MDALKMVSPIVPWPQRDNGKPYPASCLTFDTFFEYIELQQQDIESFKTFVDIAELNITERIYLVMLEAKLDIHESKVFCEGKIASSSLHERLLVTNIPL